MVLPKRERRAEENQAFVVETFERRKSSIRRTVAICPVVVTRREDGRRFQRIKITKGLDVQGIAASGGGGRPRVRSHTRHAPDPRRPGLRTRCRQAPLVQPILSRKSASQR